MSKTKEQEFIKRDLTKEACWIGEDGDMAVSCPTKIGAWRKFRALERETNGEWGNAEDIKLEDIGIGSLRLPTEEELKEDGEDYDWLITWSGKEKTPYQVWVYST